MQVPLTEDGLNANHRQNKDSVVLHDKVNQAYRGELGSAFQAKTKKRIDWVVSHITGKNVLDIGCSQGIVPIILGNKGVKVTGVDIDQKVVDDANEDLKKESRSKNNVKFICADFLKQDLEGKYDSVVLTEVLEHMYDPEEFVARAFELTKVGGDIVITVPFGINDHPDHRQNFYLLELYGIISQYYDLVDVKIIEKWIGFVGKRRKIKVEKQIPSLDLLESVEESFYRLERKIMDDIYNLTDKHNEALTDLEARKKYLKTLLKDNKRLSDDVNSLRRSKSLKIGKMITYPVRKFKK